MKRYKNILDIEEHSSTETEIQIFLPAFTIEFNTSKNELTTKKAFEDAEQASPAQRKVKNSLSSSLSPSWFSKKGWSSLLTLHCLLSCTRRVLNLVRSGTRRTETAIAFTYGYHDHDHRVRVPQHDLKFSVAEFATASLQTAGSFSEIEEGYEIEGAVIQACCATSPAVTSTFHPHFSNSNSRVKKKVRCRENVLLIPEAQESQNAFRLD